MKSEAAQRLDDEVGAAKGGKMEPAQQRALQPRPSNGISTGTTLRLVSQNDSMKGLFELDAPKVVEQLQAAGVAVNRFAINVGANDGSASGVNFEDPAAPLFRAGWAGIAFEAGDDNFSKLKANLPASNVSKVQAFVNPANIEELLAEVPADIVGFFTIDIDSDDCIVLDQALSKVRPQIVQHEVEPELPPPWEFAVMHDDGFNYGALVGHSCPLSAARAPTWATRGVPLLGFPSRHLCGLRASTDLYARSCSISYSWIVRLAL